MKLIKIGEARLDNDLVMLNTATHLKMNDTLYYIKEIKDYMVSLYNIENNELYENGKFFLLDTLMDSGMLLSPAGGGFYMIPCHMDKKNN